MKKHTLFQNISIIITGIGILAGAILLILIQTLGKTDILDILVKCYVFSIPLWIITIVSFKKK